jgi:hypothetical protein
MKQWTQGYSLPRISNNLYPPKSYDTAQKNWIQIFGTCNIYVATVYDTRYLEWSRKTTRNFSHILKYKSPTYTNL